MARIGDGYGKARAGFRCEIPDCRHPQFEDGHGRPYCEVHHIVPLAAGGEDAARNVACLCPAHHREAHHGRGAGALRDAIQRLRAADDAEAPAAPRSPVPAEG